MTKKNQTENSQEVEKLKTLDWKPDPQSSKKERRLGLVFAVLTAFTFSVSAIYSSGLLGIVGLIFGFASYFLLSLSRMIESPIIGRSVYRKNDVYCLLFEKTRLYGTNSRLSYNVESEDGDYVWVRPAFGNDRTLERIAKKELIETWLIDSDGDFSPF
jgi:hypothetical protein